MSLFIGEAHAAATGKGTSISPSARRSFSQERCNVLSGPSSYETPQKSLPALATFLDSLKRFDHRE